MPKRKPARSSPVLRDPSTPHGGEIVLYQAPDGSVKLDVRLEKETIWLNLNQMAALFERDKSVISRHLNIYKEGELEREATVAFFATVQHEGGRQAPAKWNTTTSMPLSRSATERTPNVARSFAYGRRDSGFRLRSNVLDSGRESNNGSKNNQRRQANGL